MILVRLPEKEIIGMRKTQQMLDFCSKNNIACDIELIPIKKANEAYERAVTFDIGSKSLDIKDIAITVAFDKYQPYI
jgi:hypothetical protein